MATWDSISLGISGKLHKIYLKIILPWNRESGLFNHWLASSLVEGCPLGHEFPGISELPCVGWASNYNMEVSPRTENQRDTDASERKLSVTTGTHTVGELRSRWKCGGVGHQQHPLHSSTKLSSYLISGSHEYQHSSVSSSSLSHGFLYNLYALHLPI